MKFLCGNGQEVPQQLFPAAGAWQQVKLQVSVVQLAAHLPAEQLCPSRQVVAHVPQWTGLVARSTQTPLHSVNPAAQDCWQVPDAQVWPAAQAVPQLPQFLGSVCTFVQTSAVPVPQICFGELHAQVDALQTSPGMQTTPQLPQFAPLVVVSTQVPVAGTLGQSATGAGLHAHAAAWQVPSPQSWPQAPQLAASVCLFTHLRPQASGSVTGHPQTPPEQLAPAMQDVLHSPQWRASVWRSTQTLPQAVCPVGQVVPDDAHPAPAMATSTTAIHVLLAAHILSEDAIDRLPGYPFLAPLRAGAGLRGTTSVLARVRRNLASVFCRLEPLRVDFRDGRVPGAKSSNA
jgi:hypothetical protein